MPDEVSCTDFNVQLGNFGTTCSAKLSKFVCRRTGKGGNGILTFQKEKMHQYLAIKPSSLGPTAGYGLFATKSLSASKNGGILCYMFGKLAVYTDAELTNDNPLCFGLRKNAIQYPTM